MTFRTTMLASVVLVCSATFPSASSAATLSLADLIAGTSVVQGDVTFSNFFFDDRFGVDGGTSDRNEIAYSGDRSVSASDIEITTSATADTVSLIAKVNKDLSVSSVDSTSGLPHIFDFFLDFSVSVSSSSSRQIDGVILGDGDLSAIGEGFSEVIYDIAGVGTNNDLEIFEDPGGTDPSETSDFENLIATSSLGFLGRIKGSGGIDSAADLSTFSLTFDLEGTPPVPPTSVVPLPAGLPLLLGALSILGLARRWGKAA